MFIPLRTLTLAGLLVVSPWAHADAVRDLKSALNRLQGQTPIKGQVSIKSESRQNEGKDDARVDHGAAQVAFDDSPQGLRLLYPQPLLMRAQQEDAAKDANPKAKTPTVTGLSSLDHQDVRQMTRAADDLLRTLNRSTFKNERTDTWQGQAARVVSFDVPLREPNKYAKKFSNVLEVWVGADGTPLAARQTQTMSGRAMMVISFEMSATEETHYTVVGERLVAVRRNSQSSGEGAGEKGKQSRQLQLELAS
ncbi:MAG: hypothetical protein O9335_03310 [Inhella sp.]|jgi:hypothetical protein|uniref:hypothetical protein n=1 Tax=Inhella sp. TaxID=1921806 RepID=UPI0022CB630A|nr:hypothetical protein [Inhella sp.]MCZ8234165.1 hypothetical protein [Inhella sp.]